MLYEKHNFTTTSFSPHTCKPKFVSIEKQNRIAFANIACGLRKSVSRLATKTTEMAKWTQYNARKLSGLHWKKTPTTLHSKRCPCTWTALFCNPGPQISKKCLRYGEWAWKSRPGSRQLARCKGSSQTPLHHHQ